MPSLRFVEINGNKKNVEILENLPSQIVGHQGEIKPQITNGHISRHHATVCFNESEESWLVIDGNTITGMQSKNGLKDINGDPIVGKVTLRDAGDRVYLLFMYNTNAYLEVFATNKEIVEGTTGLEEQSIQPEISTLVVNTSLLKNDVKSAIDLANVNKGHLETVNNRQVEMSSRIDSVMEILDKGLNQVEDIGKNPKQFLLGFLIFTFGAVSMLAVYGIYRNLDEITKEIFRIEDKLEIRH